MKRSRPVFRPAPKKSAPGEAPVGEPVGAPGAPAALALVWLGPADLMKRLPIEALLNVLSGGNGRGHLEALTLRELARRLDTDPAPDVVLSPLFWRGGDVMEAARLMNAQGWPGPYRVISPPLPRPGMVETEVKLACPGLDIALIPLPRR